jgi:Zn-finger nucleic acid-binding protein
MHERNAATTAEASLELKYCERCGGLWLRPPGSGQIYCTTCFRAIAELPPSSVDVKKRRKNRREDREFVNFEIDEIGLDFGGAA